VKCAHGAEVIAAERPLSSGTITVTPRGHGVTRTYRIVLLCNTDESRTRGLQGFRMLKPDEAALFVFPEPRPVTFWMGSVVYPIDIIFVGPDKKVLRIYPDCRPGSRQYYPSLVPIQWVVETAAGSGTRVGDRVTLQ
jgi:uncharacterized membrane protein (UPF0127 family)